jgi:hypothetical protein
MDHLNLLMSEFLSCDEQLFLLRFSVNQDVLQAFSLISYLLTITLKLACPLPVKCCEVQHFAGLQVVSHVYAALSQFVSTPQ